MDAKRPRRPLFISARAASVLLVVLLLLPMPWAGARLPTDPSRYAVVLRDGVATVPLGGSFDGGRVVALNDAIHALSIESADEGFLARAQADARVASAELVPLRPMVSDEPTFEVSDPRVTDQVGLAQIHAQQAWAAAGTLGDANHVAVCIVDSGVRYTHEDLAGVRWRGGYDFVNNDPDPMDDLGHGTHVAGIAAASINNSLGIAGVANVSLYGVKVLDASGRGSDDIIAMGVSWCANDTNTPPDTIISMSLAGPERTQVLQDAIHNATLHGRLVVAAAGNGACNDCVQYPAAYPDVIAVSCVDSLNAPCSFSSKGPQVALAAPGSNVLSLWDGSDSDYRTASGTSMSTPFVSGALALAWSAHPELTAAALRARLLATTRDVGARGHDDATGFGVLDAACLVRGTIPCGDVPAAPDCGAVLDAFGYVCAPTPPAPRTLGADATTVHLGDEGLSLPILLPFDFSFYGVPQDRLWISPNGYVTFERSYSSGCCAGQELPDANAPNDVIAGSWGDLNPQLGGTIRYATLGAAPEREFVVDFHGVPDADGLAPATFQIILHESTDVAEVQVIDAPSDGHTRVVGIEDASGHSGLRAAYGTAPLHQQAWAFLPPEHLSAPRHLVATAADVGVNLSWDPPLHAHDLSGYAVYRTPEPPGTGLNVFRTDACCVREEDLGAVNNSTTTFADRSAVPHVRYHYRVLPLASGQQDDGPSARVSVLSPGDPTPCAVPTDAAGYTCAVEPFAFAEVAGTPAAMPIFLGDDVISTAEPVGFNFTFYGHTYDHVYVGSNGFIGFDPSISQGCCSGATIPGSYIHNIIAGDWEDQYPPGGGVIYLAQLGEAPHRTLVVEWKDVVRYYSGPRVTFEIVLHEGTNAIEVQAKDVPDDYGHIRTMGIEDPSGAMGVEYAHGNYTASALGVLFAPPKGALPTAPQNLTLADGVLTWDAPADSGAGPALRYVVTRSAPCAPDLLLGETTTTSFSVSAQSAATYRVAAENALGAGDAATTQLVMVTDAPMPGCVGVALDPARAASPDGVYGGPVTARFFTRDGGVAFDPTTLRYVLDGGVETLGDNVTITTNGHHSAYALANTTGGTVVQSDVASVTLDTVAPSVRVMRSGFFEDALPSAEKVAATATNLSAAAVPFQMWLSFSKPMDQAATSAALTGTDGWQLYWSGSQSLALYRADGWTTPPPLVLRTSATDVHGNALPQAFAFSTSGPAVATTLTVPAPNGQLGWYTTAPTATLTAAPGTARITYALDAGDDIAYTGPFAVPVGAHVLRYNATADGLPNETAHFVPFFVDNEPPILGTLVITPARPHAGSTVQLSLPVTDTLSGAHAATLLVGGAAVPTTFDGRYANATLTNVPLGTLLVSATASDAAGNSRTSDVASIPVTAPTPTTTASVDPALPNGAHGWYNTTPTVTLANDTPGATTTYSIDGGAAQSYGAPFAIPDGDHVLSYFSTGPDGSAESPRTLELLVDTAAPTLGATTFTPAHPALGQDVQVSVPVSDAASGVRAVQLYAGPTALVTTFSGGVATATAHPDHMGALAFTAHVLDAAGNARDADAGSVDVLAPVAPPAAPPPTPVPPGAVGAPSVTFDAGRVRVAWTAPSDPGVPGVAGYHVYRDGALVGDVGGFSFTDGGVSPGVTYAYAVAAYNGAGEAPRSAPSSVRVPGVAVPTSAATSSPPAPDGSEGWFLSAPSVTLTASSPDATILYHLDDGAEATYTGPVTIPAGRHTLHWHATQTGAASDEPEHAQDYAVDDAAPTVGGAALSATSATVGTPITLQASARDVGSGLASVMAQLSDGTTVSMANIGGDSYFARFTPTTPGTYAVDIIATDHAGHATRASAGSFRLDAVQLQAVDNSTSGTSPPTTPTGDGSGGNGGEPLQPASTGGSGGGSSGGSSSPSPTAPPPTAPPSPAVVLTPQNASIDLSSGARGNLHVAVQNAPHPEQVTFYAVNENGTERQLGTGGAADWDTTSSEDGYYTVQARDAQNVTIASARVLVRNHVLSVGQALTGAAIGVGTVVAAGAATNLVTNTLVGAGASTVTSAGSAGASTVVSSGSQGFSFTQYLKDLFADAGSDAFRDKTKDLAAIERRRRVRSVVAVVVSVTLLAVFFSIAEAGSFSWSAILGVLPYVAPAAVILSFEKYLSESLIDHLSGARVRFRLWVAGIVSLALSTVLFRNPFGYPGYVDNGEERSEDERRYAGHRALAILAFTAAWGLPFLVAAHYGLYAFGSVGLSMAIVNLATASVPFGPAAGAEVRRWNKWVAAAAAVAGFGLYFAYEIGVLPEYLLVGVGLAGIVTYVVAAVHYARRREPPHHVPVETSVPVRDADAASAEATSEKHAEP